MRIVLIVLSVLGLSACASIKQVDSGRQTLGHLVLETQGAWNEAIANDRLPARVWTAEGLPIDELMIYADVADGDGLCRELAENCRPGLEFRSNMSRQALLSLFESLLTGDGSSYRLLGSEPYAFAGREGFRFDYELVRKLDRTRLRGTGFGTVDHGRLYALLYQAPRLTFFPRYQSRIEAMARGAILK